MKKFELAKELEGRNFTYPISQSIVWGIKLNNKDEDLEDTVRNYIEESVGYKNYSNEVNNAMKEFEEIKLQVAITYALNELEFEEIDFDFLKKELEEVETHFEIRNILQLSI